MDQQILNKFVNILNICPENRSSNFTIDTKLILIFFIMIIKIISVVNYTILQQNVIK